MSAKIVTIAALAAASSVHAATAPPDDAAVAGVFRQTVEQSAGALTMKPGQTCEKPKVQRFTILKRGVFTKDPTTGRAVYPVTADVDLRCGADPAVERRWNGQLEIQLYENSLNAWTMRW